MADTMGRRIRDERLAKKLSYSVLSKRCGVSPGMLSDLEHGRSKGSTKIHKIASALGLNTRYVTDGTGHKYTTHGIKDEGPAWAAKPEDGPDEQLIKLLGFWNKLLPESKKHVVDQAIVTRATQNAADPPPKSGIPRKPEKDKKP